MRKEQPAGARQKGSAAPPLTTGARALLAQQAAGYSLFFLRGLSICWCFMLLAGLLLLLAFCWTSDQAACHCERPTSLREEYVAVAFGLFTLFQVHSLVVPNYSIDRHLLTASAALPIFTFSCLRI